MKRLLSIVLLCVLVPCVYGETINYDDGGKYVGEVSNGVPHGNGTYTFANGDKYIGEWKNFIYHGHGIYTFASGDKYIGEFKDDVKWNGVYYRADGTVKGTYIQGVAEVEGSSCVKEREYTEDGKSMIDCEFADGDRYIGGYENGNWNGHGTYIHADGNKYIGEFKDGLQHGNGTYIFADGSKYIGEFKDDLYNGHGTYIKANGEKYIGEFKDDLYHGYGTYIYADGSKYIGEYKDDLQWNGVYYNSDETVRGTYSNGEWIAK
jgi:hypothetical protein